MNGWGVINNLITVVSRFPLERFVANRSEKDLDKFEQRLREKGLLTPQSVGNVKHFPQETGEVGAVKVKNGSQNLVFPTTDQTVKELNRRLAKELYKAELDLVAGLKIEGNPCDCLSEKHALELEAASEELISYGTGNPVYAEIITWLKQNQPKITPEAVATGSYDKEYPAMAAQFRDFRKRVLGTTNIRAMVGPAETLTADHLSKLTPEDRESIKQKAHSLLDQKLDVS